MDDDDNDDVQESLANAMGSARQCPWWIGIQYPHLAENCVFFIPLSYSAPPLPIFPFELGGEVKRQETRVTGLLCGEGCVILTSTVFHWSTRVTDRRPDRRPYGQTVWPYGHTVWPYGQTVWPYSHTHIRRPYVYGLRIRGHIRRPRICLRGRHIATALYAAARQTGDGI